MAVCGGVHDPHSPPMAAHRIEPIDLRRQVPKVLGIGRGDEQSRRHHRLREDGLDAGLERGEGGMGGGRDARWLDGGKNLPIPEGEGVGAEDLPIPEEGERS
eukprot:scaffold8733_cov114-Isochrysis_galbana.AAC.2